jgi:hypothetical protein
LHVASPFRRSAPGREFGPGVRGNGIVALHVASPFRRSAPGRSFGPGVRGNGIVELHVASPLRCSSARLVLRPMGVPELPLFSPPSSFSSVQLAGGRAGGGI